MKKFKSIKEYLENLPFETKDSLLKLKEFIYLVMPNAEELFKSNYLKYVLVKNGNKNNQIMINGYANHVSFYPHPLVISLFKEELKDYKTGKGTVQFPNNKPLPKDLIIRMVKSMKQIIEEY